MRNRVEISEENFVPPQDQYASVMNIVFIIENLRRNNYFSGSTSLSLLLRLDDILHFYKIIN